MDLKTIDRNIKLVKTNGLKWNILVHTVAVAILEHAQATGDCTRALALVEAMPKSSKRASLIEWFGMFSPIGMNVNERKVRFHKPEAKAYRPFDVEKAKDNPWYDLASAQNEDLPDTTLEQAHKYVFQLAAKLGKKIDNGEVAANDKEAITKLIGDLKVIGAKQYREVKAARAAAKAA